MIKPLGTIYNLKINTELQMSPPADNRNQQDKVNNLLSSIEELVNVFAVTWKAQLGSLNLNSK